MTIKQTLDIFLLERRENWINKKTKGQDVKEDKLTALKLEANQRYDLNDWIFKAIKSARPSITTHPSTFTHSDAKSTAISFLGLSSNDGFLKTGNVKITQEFDVFGNAATDSTVWDTYLFLCSKAGDNKLIIDHFKDKTEESKSFIESLSISYEETRKKFLVLFEEPSNYKTSQLLKQVYFPVENDYHLLSLVTASGLLNRIKNQMDYIRYSEDTKNAKQIKKTNQYHDSGYDDLFDITVIAFGGTKPQNISVLNSQNAGRAYLLASTPPKLKHRDIRLPNQDFFKNSLRTSQFRDSFQTLHSLMIVPVNNVHLRNGISNTLKYIIDQVLQRAFKIRSTTIGWSNAEHYQSLPLAQRIWLDDEHTSKRQNEDEWINQINHHFARWILQAYEFCCKDSHIKLSDHELHEIRNYVNEALANDQEFFR